MSRTTEESEKCDLDELEEHLNKIKECGEFIEESYKNAKEKYNSIAKEDQTTAEFETSFRKIIEHLKNVCKETVKKVKDLEDNGLSKMYRANQVEKESEKECVAVVENDSPTSKNNDTVDKEQINSDKKADGNRSDCSVSHEQDMTKNNSDKEIRKDKSVDDSNKGNSEIVDTLPKNGSEDSIPTVNELETVNKEILPEQKKKKENEEANKNLDKENEKPEENNVESKAETKDPPKGIIRVISIEKLLDPSIAAFHKRSQKPTQYSNLFNSSIIVLDSDDDEPSAPVAPQKDPKQKESANKTVNKEIPALKVSKASIEERRKGEHKKNQCSPKLKKVAVRLKSSKFLKEMLEKKRFKIKLSKLEKGLDSEPELNQDKCTASAKRLHTRNSVDRRRELSSNFDDDDTDNGRRKTNRAASKKARTKIKEIGDSDMDSTSEQSESATKSRRARRNTKIKQISSSSSEDESVASLKKKINDKKLSGDESKKDKEGKESSDNDTDNEATEKSRNGESRNNKEILNSSSDEDIRKKKTATSNKKSEEDCSDAADQLSGRDSDKSDNSSDSAVIRKKRKKAKSSSKESDEDMSSDAERKKKNKRKRIRNSDDSESSGNEDGANKKRKNIRKVLKKKDLEDDTKKATREEEERRKRIEERQRLYNKIYEKPENVELNELVLDFDEESKEKLLSVDSGLLKKLKPHQAAGIKFMWDACFETLKDTRKKPGSGCILAHCMGLGKTLQIVALTHTLLIHNRKTKIERVLIITPLSTLNNWAKEYIYWMKFCKKRDIEIYDMSKWREKNLRVYKIKEWFDEGGVLIIGYDMYRILSNPNSTTIKKKQRESLQTCLVDPGPDLVVCDEGHLLKNEKTSLSQAVNRLRTKRRIVLTGTPLQNNLKEYYCMIQFIKPNLLGTYKEYLNRFVNPISNGQYTDSTERDIKLMKHRSHVLHKLLEGCIQRRDYSVLAPYLPPKHEYVIFITLSDMQKKLYEFYMTKQRDIITEAQYGGKGAMLFQDFQNLRRIWTHPMCLRVNSDTVIKKRLAKDFSDSEGSLKDFIDDGGDTSSSSSESSSDSSDSDKSEKSKKSAKSDKASKSNAPSNKARRTRGNPTGGNDDDIEIIEEAAEDDPSEWWKPICPEEELSNINHSPKLLLLMEILEMCESIGDKILLFSQSLQSLDVIENFLALIDKKTQGDEIEGNVANFSGSWTPGVDYFRLDGSSSVESREAMCKTFNDVTNLRGRLFLISTRAGSLGINLVAANRVIIFDVSWNPSHDTQSIFRIYRFGQDKPCYIYRFISQGTMEQKVYERQVAKQATAKRVVDEQQIGRHYNQNDLQELYKYELEPIAAREVPSLPKDRLFADLLPKHEKLIYKYHEHDSLLENEESENLSEEERKAAWAEYEAEKDRPANQFIAYNRPVYGNMNGPVTSNKVFGIRTDVLLKLLNVLVRTHYPALTDTEVVRMVPVYLQRLYAQMNANDATMYRELLELHAQLEIPQGYYMNPAAFQQTSMIGLNPMAFINQQQQEQFVTQPPANNSSVYEIE